MRKDRCSLRQWRTAFVFALLTALTFTMGREAVAGQFSVRGQVEFVRTHDSQIFPNWAPPFIGSRCQA